MKKTGECPKCGSAIPFHSDCIMDRGDGNEAMCLSIKRSDSIEAKEVGQFEVYVCRSCGYSELYVQNPSELEDLRPSEG